MNIRVARRLLVAAAALGLLAAAPLTVGGVQAGQWEVSRSAGGAGGTRLCAPGPAVLAQFEHHGQFCTPMVLSDRQGDLVIDYTCFGGDFGRTRMTVLTPRSLRMETQGIHRGEPFHYQLHARRVGDC